MHRTQCGHEVTADASGAALQAATLGAPTARTTRTLAACPVRQTMPLLPLPQPPALVRDACRTLTC